MAEQNHQRVARHYGRGDLEAAVLRALRSFYGDLTALQPADLHPIDEFHVRGHQATRELAAMLGDLAGLEVLDVGSGLGGGARYLASTWGCRVTGIDATPEYVALAGRLSQLVSLSDLTDFGCGSALRMPFKDSRFDVAWMQHAQMNMDDKRLLVREIARVLRPRGRMAFHEIFCNGRSRPHLPAPWADDASNSHLVSADSFRALLEAEEMKLVQWKDVTESAANWGRTARHRLETSGPPPLGVHLLMGDGARVKLGNLWRSLEEGLLRVVQAVFSKSA